MKKLSIAALIVLCLASSLPCHAADWSDDHFSCDIDVISTGAPGLNGLFRVYLWGTWRELDVSFYVTKQTDRKVKFRCKRGGSYLYTCSAEPGSFTYHYKQYCTNRILITPDMSPGISKKDACKLIFDTAGFKWEE